MPFEVSLYWISLSCNLNCFLFLQIRYCEDLGISSEKGSHLFIYYGGCSAIGRLLAGILCNHPRVNAFFVFQAAEFVVGLSTILVALTRTYTPLVIYIVIYGLSDGFFFTSLSVILLTASPLKTAAVLGWEMMLTSVFLASGPPLAGKKCFVLEGFHCHAIKIKIENHSMNDVKKLTCYRR